MDDGLNLGMFKAYDIRTKVGLLNEQITVRLVASIGSYILEDLHAEQVLICRDARLAAPWVVETMLQIFSDLGLDVLVNPMPVSTCQFYYSCMQHRSAAGIMVTASHNPGNYIGCKLMAPGFLPLASGYGPKGGIEEIRRKYIENRPISVSPMKGRVRVVYEGEQFVDYSLRIAGVKEGALSGLSVLGEFLSGSAGLDVSMAFEKAGATFVPRHLVPDGQFRYGDPNPIIETSIAPAREAMKQGRFNLGFCFDGDGDRLDLMTASGEQLVPGFNMAVLVPYLQELFQGAFPHASWNPQFYADVKAIPTALVEIAKTGVGVHIIRNGHSFIKGKLKDNFSHQYLAAEEESAHYYMNFPVDPQDWSKGSAAIENTLFFALLTARAWHEEPAKYERMLEIQKGLWREREWPLHFDSAPDRMEQILLDVEHEMVRRGATVIKTMDDGTDLDATLMRFGLPGIIDRNTRIAGDWCQVSQRISRSEDAMTRWEVAAGTESLCAEMNSAIREIADRYVSAGYARY